MQPGVSRRLTYADPGAAFSEGMSAAMDFMADAGMPPDMMANMQMSRRVHLMLIWQQTLTGDPMDAFDAVGAGLDMHMAEFPADMPCMDMAGDFPPPPEDCGPMMDGAPPYGDFAGGPGVLIQVLCQTHGTRTND